MSPPIRRKPPSLFVDGEYVGRCSTITTGPVDDFGDSSIRVVTDPVSGYSMRMQAPPDWPGRATLYVDGVPTAFRLPGITFNRHPTPIPITWAKDPATMTTTADRPRKADRFKVGDRVRIADSFSTTIGRAFIGKTATVIARKSDRSPFDYRDYYLLATDDGKDTGYVWWDCELEPLLPIDVASLFGDPEPFWLVWRDPGEGRTWGSADPTRPHWSETEARAEAQRLAEKHPGCRFVVVRSVASETCAVQKCMRSERYAEAAS